MWRRLWLGTCCFRDLSQLSRGQEGTMAGMWSTFWVEK